MFIRFKIIIRFNMFIHFKIIIRFNMFIRYKIIIHLKYVYTLQNNYSL